MATSVVRLRGVEGKGPRALPDLVGLIEQAQLEDLPSIAGRLREAEALAELRLRMATNRAPAPPPPAQAANLSVRAAAARMGVSASYVYKRAAALPFVRRIGRRVVCDAAALERWMRQRPGGGLDAR